MPQVQIKNDQPRVHAFYQIKGETRKQVALDPGQTIVVWLDEEATCIAEERALAGVGPKIKRLAEAPARAPATPLGTTMGEPAAGPSRPPRKRRKRKGRRSQARRKPAAETSSDAGYTKG